jgi:hypothetical protein
MMTKRAVSYLFVLLLGATPAAAQSIERHWVALERISTTYVPPPEYAVWWQAVVAECDCTPAVELSAIAWQRVDAATFECANGLRCHGYYIPSLVQAFIVAGDVDREVVVKHEMRHAILGGDPEHRHPSWRCDLALRSAARGVL